MSYFYIRPILGGVAGNGDQFPDADEPPVFIESRTRADRAIDSALRSVPLPEGLMARLGKLVSTLTDNGSDRLDYFGC